MTADTELLVPKIPSLKPAQNMKIIHVNDNELLFQDLKKLQLDPLLSRLVILSTKLGCSAEVLIIVSMETIYTKLFLENGLNLKMDSILTKFLVVESDYLTLLRMYKAWESHKFSASWCIGNGVKPSDLLKVQEFRRQLVLILWKHKIPLVSCGIYWLVLLKCISVTYFHQSARLVDAAEGRYDSCKSGAALYIYPSSAVMNLGRRPDVIVYHQLILATNLIYMRGVTIIDADWVPSLGAPLLHALKSVKQKAKEEKKTIKASQVQVRVIIRSVGLGNILN